MYTGNNCELLINCDRGDQSISQCRSWSSLGFCNLKYTYNGVSVPMYCPISCNMCNQQCTDAVNECSNWATQGTPLKSSFNLNEVIKALIYFI